MAKDSNQITHISNGTKITGELLVENDVHIAGSISGKITSSGHLSVESSGKVEAEIKVKSATISGTIIGNLECSNRLELNSGSSITGDIKTKEIVIHEGAIFQGNCSMNQSGTDEKK